MRRAIRKHLRDFVAIVVLSAIALFVGLYIATNQRLRIPYFQPKPFEIYAAMSTAQAVTPGQGQTVQISGVEIGQIGEVRLVDGRGVIKLQIEPRYRKLIRRNAAALLRPRTGLKDMYIQLNPGTVRAPAAPEGWTIPVRNTLPDVNLDEVLLALDADTRDYVRLLVSGTGRGLHGRGGELAEVFRRFEPTVRDLAAVNRAVAQERAALRRLITSLASLNRELASGDNPRDLAELVDASAITFRAFASEQAGLRATVRELPPSLQQATTTLRTVRTFANELGPTSRALLPAVRELDDANLAVRPFAREATPIVRDEIRPFTREIRPLLTDLQPAAQQLADATPDLTRSFVVLNHLFNMLGYNKDGRENPKGDPNRDEGYLFWIAWVTHDTINLFNVDDANGPLRPVFLTGTCTTLLALGRSNPLAPFLLNLTPLFSAGGPCEALGPLSLDVASARRELIAAQKDANVKPSAMIGGRDAVEEGLGKAKDTVDDAKDDVDETKGKVDDAKEKVEDATRGVAP